MCHILFLGLISQVLPHNLLPDDFLPKDPVLKSDIGLMSVNIPPVYIREQFWLHSIAMDIPFVDEIIKPNIIVMTNEMNYSTTAIMTMARKIDIEKLNKESRERILGPLHSLNQTHFIFLSHLKEVRRKYFDIVGEPTSLWGILSKNRCNSKSKDIDIVSDGKEEAMQHLARRRRQVPSGLESNKHNVINVEGSGHTFIFNHGSPGKEADTMKGSTRLILPYAQHTPQSESSSKSSPSVTEEGQMFLNLQAAENINPSQLHPHCEISYQNRMRYLNCIITQDKTESICFLKYLVCNQITLPTKSGLFDFLGDVQNKLYGVATEEQLNKLHDLIKSGENMTFRNSDEIKLLRNSTITMSNHIMNVCYSSVL